MNKITIQNGKLNVPDNVIIPFIQGDGVGAEIMPVCQKVINEALLKAYGTTKSIEWKELLAGDKAHQTTGEWLTQSTLDGFKEYLVGIKGPLTTPIGGGFRSLNVALRHPRDDNNEFIARSATNIISPSANTSMCESLLNCKNMKIK